MGTAKWRAGFELEVILGNLGEDRFSDPWDGGMDEATPAFCQAVAKHLTVSTGVRWTAPRKKTAKTGYFVVSEYGLDPLNWPRDRVAGVELLTPPLPLDEADAVRREITEAIINLDGFFNIDGNRHTTDCGWHINIDAGDLAIRPYRFILGVDEIHILLDNNRIYSEYAGMQRHAVGIPLLRQLEASGSALMPRYLGNLLSVHAGRGKGFAANFDKLAHGYVELRHFAAKSFFDDRSLVDHLGPILDALELRYAQEGPFDDIFLRRFEILHQWMNRHGSEIEWDIEDGISQAHGKLRFGGEPLGTLLFDGDLDVYIDAKKNEWLAVLRGAQIADVREAVALLALDYAELRLIGSKSRSPNAQFNRAVAGLAKQLAGDPSLSIQHQFILLRKAAHEREVNPMGYPGDSPKEVPA